MIVTRLMGGVGNQMFQYALGRRLAIDHQVPLKLDLTYLATQAQRKLDTPRPFALSGWRIKAEEATPADLAQFPPLPDRRVGRFLSVVLPRRRGTVLKEANFAFHPKVLGVRPPALLVGYWQSARYFDSIERELRDDFSLSHAPCEHVAPLLQTLPDAGAISVHIRRGDYVSNKVTNAYHGVCSMEYYHAACARIAGEIGNPRFIVVSDEPLWVRENLKLRWPMTVVEHGAACQPHDDIWLMSRCSHHVIANSSFSWWGAWLGINPGRRVVAPRTWFNLAKQPTEDLLPEHWIKL